MASGTHRSCIAIDVSFVFVFQLAFGDGITRQASDQLAQSGALHAIKNNEYGSDVRSVNECSYVSLRRGMHDIVISTKSAVECVEFTWNS